MNIVLPYEVLKKDFNWNIMYIKNYSYDCFKINYSDMNCIIENAYISVPNIKTHPEDFLDFSHMFNEFNRLIFNRCKSIISPKDYMMDTNKLLNNVLSNSNSDLVIRINNIQINDNVISLNYDNIYINN